MTNLNKIRDELAKQWRDQYTRPIFANGYEEAFKYGFDAAIEVLAKQSVDTKRAFDRVVEALKFYADEERWGDSKDIARPTGNKCFDICLFDFDRSFKKGTDVAGAKARQALKDVGVDV